MKKILLSIASLAMTTAPIVSLGNCGSKPQPAPTLDSIELSGEYKTNFYVGESLDLTGLVVTGHFNNGSSRILSNEEYTTDPKEGTALKESDKTVTVTAVVGDVTKEQSFDITVSPVVLESITLNTDSTKTNYYVGENLNLTGLVVTGHFNNGKTRTLTSEEYTTDPGEETVLKESDKIVTVTASVDGVEKTNTFNINVSPVVLESITLNTDSTKT
ncbi:MAG: bacterial Ig-like domain-containing protein, partial [Mycoplasmoidaceae bacterium]|nr:bacterial Ig-like domain-containing protein [Mycoplasmoidaceae bacterium]